MAHKYVLDTHALVWHLEGNPRLGPQAKKVIDDPLSSLVSAHHSSCGGSLHCRAWPHCHPQSVRSTRIVFADLRIAIYPLTWEVFQESLNATVLPEMHDRLIVGSALQLQSLGDTISLLTKDTSIIEARLVPTLW